MSRKDASSLAKIILKKLEEDTISISDCRGQTYNNNNHHHLKSNIKCA